MASIKQNLMRNQCAEFLPIGVGCGTISPPAMTARSIDLPIIQRGNRFILQKTFEGKQRQVTLGTKLKTAQSRALRFLATAEKSGFDTAKEELSGKPVIKAGCNPTFEEFEKLYREFCKQSAKAPRIRTIDKNLQRLKFIMSKLGVLTIAKIDKDQLYKKWFHENDAPTPQQNRTFASAVSCASGCFKISALTFYASKGIPIKNPFKGLEISKPKVKQYVPMSEELRKTIWNDCQTELLPCETMIVLMALGIGMRISEINASIPAWFSKQSENVTVHIKEEAFFTPKAGEDGVVPISSELYELLLKFRGDSDSIWFVPFRDEDYDAGRLRKRFEAVNRWLHEKGFNKRNPLHSLRKECGSIIAKKCGILEASKVLRNTVQVCAVHYAGIAELNTVDVGGSFAPKKDLFSQLAEEMGTTPDKIREKLGITAAT